MRCAFVGCWDYFPHYLHSYLPNHWWVLTFESFLYFFKSFFLYLYFTNTWESVVCYVKNSLVVSFLFVSRGINSLLAQGVYDSAFPLHDVSKTEASASLIHSHSFVFTKQYTVQICLQSKISPDIFRFSVINTSSSKDPISHQSNLVQCSGLNVFCRINKVLNTKAYMEPCFILGSSWCQIPVSRGFILSVSPSVITAMHSFIHSFIWSPKCSHANPQKSNTVWLVSWHVSC